MKLNRLFCIMPILLLALSLSARAAYSDVPADEWYAGAVDYCAANALMQGVGDGRFAPQETVTRATVLTVLHRLSGSPAASKRGAFSDVPANEWYAEAADWAAETGLAYGVGDGRLAPGDTVARQDLAVFLWRLKGSPKAAEPAGFPDEADVYGYALDAVRWASAEGIVVGTGDGSFAPHGSATRAQLATILMRVHRGAADSRSHGSVCARRKRLKALVRKNRQRAGAHDAARLHRNGRRAPYPWMAFESLFHGIERNEPLADFHEPVSAAEKPERPFAAEFHGVRHDERLFHRERRNDDKPARFVHTALDA